MSFALRKELSQRFEGAGYSIGPEEWAVLLVLWSKGPQSPSKLSEETIKDRTTVTRLIDAMVRKELVIRSENPMDRRRSDISLTAAGEALESQLVAIAMEMIAQVTEGVSQRDLEATSRTLQRLSSNLTSVAQGPPTSEKRQ